ncbi:MAG: hypothetical protein WAV91_06030, partial [Aquabacterium sp.]
MSPRQTDAQSTSSPTQAAGARYSRIAGTGSFLPPNRVTNADMVERLAQDGIETSDDWIVERTGIRARHFADPSVSS